MHTTHRTVIALFAIILLGAFQASAQEFVRPYTAPATVDAPQPANPNQSAVPDPSKDTDKDGIVDAKDNCPTSPNANQADRDGDKLGDSCDSIDNTKLAAATATGPGWRTKIWALLKALLWFVLILLGLFIVFRLIGYARRRNRQRRNRATRGGPDPVEPNDHQHDATTLGLHDTPTARVARPDPDPDLNLADLDRPTPKVAVVTTNEPAVRTIRDALTNRAEVQHFQHLHESVDLIGRASDPANLILVDAALTGAYTQAGNIKRLVPTSTVLMFDATGPQNVDVDLARANGEVDGIVTVPLETPFALSAFLNNVLTGNATPRDLWPIPGTGNPGLRGPAMIIAFAIILGSAAAANAQGIVDLQPRTIVPGYQPAAYQLTVEGNCEPNRLLASPHAKLTYTDLKRVGNVISFKASAAADAKAEPTQLGVVCKDGRTVRTNGLALKVRSADTNELGWYLSQQLAARDARIAGLEKKVANLKPGGSTTVDPVARRQATEALRIAQANSRGESNPSPRTVTNNTYATAAEVERLNKRLDETIKVYDSNFETLRTTTIPTMMESNQALRAEVEQLRATIVTVGDAVNMAADKKTGGILGIGRKPIVTDDLQSKMQAELRKLGWVPTEEGPKKDKPRKK